MKAKCGMELTPENYKHCLRCLSCYRNPICNGLLNKNKPLDVDTNKEKVAPVVDKDIQLLDAFVSGHKVSFRGSTIDGKKID